MSDAAAEIPGGLERLRRAASRAALATFGLSFAALLVLSATPYWTPENPWILWFDRVWKASGLAALVLGSIPRVRKLGGSILVWIGLRE